MQVSHTLAAAPEDWKNTPYAHETTNKPLEEFLQDFSLSVGLQLKIDDKLPSVVEGKLRADNLVSLMDRLALEHRFQWFVYNNTLHISALNQQTSTRLEVAQESIQDLKQALTNIDLLDDRFGWGELPDIGVVLVSGPKRYIEYIKQFARKQPDAADKQEVLVFELKYANAADRLIDYRGEKLTIPGVASILRGLLSTPSNQTPVAASAPPSPPPHILANRGGSFLNIPTPPIASDKGSLPPSSTQLTAGTNIRVEADARNNSVLIYDSAQRNALYQTLAAKLDVSRNLVEIDALILDINRTQLNALGVHWGFQNRHFGAGFNNLSAGSSSTVTITDINHFVAQVRALEERGLATVVSNPSIMTLENQPAVIDFNRTQYIQAVGEGVADIMPVTVGTSFQVVPRVITANGAQQIHLIIDIEDGDFSSDKSQGAGPEIKKGRVSTQAVMAEMQSLVIGGFHVSEESDTLRRVPWLGRIPFLGKALFSSSQNTNNRRERLFILTPRLIGDQINPSRYLPQTDQAHLESTLTPLARRYARSTSTIKRSEIAQNMTHLVSGRVPDSFTSRPMPHVAKPWCNTPKSLRVDPTKYQWYEGPDYSVAILVLHNTSNERVRIDESECSNEHTLAVSIWPTPWLAAGEKAEVLIATRTAGDKNMPPTRPSLLSLGRSAAQ